MNTGDGSMTPDSSAASRGAGLTLIISTLLGVVVLSHHPGIPFSELVQGGDAARRLAVASAWVHGILMVWLVIGYCCFVEFALQRGLRRPLVRIGLILYSIGVLAMLGAAILDGFVTSQVPVVVAKLAGAGTLQEPAVIRQLVILSSALNQALANVGAVGMALGSAAWSLALLRDRPLERAVGILGFTIAVTSIASLLAGVLVLSRHGILVLEAGQGLWTLAVGALMLRRRVG